MVAKQGEAERRGTVRSTTKLRTLLVSGRIAVAPGAYDGLSARLVEQAGFHAIYASGGAIARSASVPGIGLIPINAIVDRLASIVDVVARRLDLKFLCEFAAK